MWDFDAFQGLQAARAVWQPIMFYGSCFRTMLIEQTTTSVNTWKILLNDYNMIETDYISIFSLSSAIARSQFAFLSDNIIVLDFCCNFFVRNNWFITHTCNLWSIYTIITARIMWLVHTHAHAHALYYCSEDWI